MIRKLRFKLIAASMFSLALVLFLILGGINLVSYRKAVTDADSILQVLGSNDGTFPMREPVQTGESALPEPPTDHGRGGRQPGLTAETPYESRYFSVLVNGTGQVVQVDTGQIAAVDEEDAADYALQVWSSGSTAGFVQDYRYLRCEETEGTRIIFLDCTRSLSNCRATLTASVGLAVLGLGAVFLLLMILSGRIVRPMAESYEKQKRFITDAGHELKTPLTIIGADADLVEMECGENQWLEDIRRQAQRLTGLTNDLIFLSRMEEDQPPLQAIEFPLSDVVEEMAQSFQGPARGQNKELQVQVQPLLSYTGDEKGIRQLVSILLDNALKYSPENTAVSLCLEKKGRTVQLTVENTTEIPLEKDQLEHLFDRFYRADQSRNSRKGGHGLGLSIAKGIVHAHKGKIRAEAPDAARLVIRVALPA